MERTSDYEPSNKEERYAEIDESIRAAGLTLTVVCAMVSLAFWSRSPLLVLACWAPTVWRGVRVALVRDNRSLYRWAVWNGFISGASVVLAAAATGGLSSPVLVFAIVVGLLTSMAFAHQPLWNLFPVGIVLCVAAIDYAGDGLEDVDLLVACATAIVAIAVPRLASDMVNVELSYRKKAVLDPLTGCLNRTSLAIRSSELQHQATHTNDYVGVIAIDIDKFKTVNDRFGHAVGDQILQQVAYVIRRNLRRFELLYRTGGEEFVLLVPGASPKVAHRMGEIIRRSVADEQFVVGDVTVSVGVASVRAPRDLDSLIDQADQSLLEAKNTGRNRTVSSAVTQQ